MDKLSYYNTFNENRQYIRDLINSGKISKEVINVLKNGIDPTDNSKFLPWLIKQFLSNSDFPFYEAKELLDKYLFYIEHNLTDKKDINFFKTLQELKDYLKSIEHKKSNKQLRNEKNIIIENEYISLYRPDTNEGCRQLAFSLMSDDGIDPKWCIIPKNSSEWDSYYVNKMLTFYLLKLKKIPEGYNEPFLNDVYYKSLGIAVGPDGDIDHIENKKPGVIERQLSKEEINSIVDKKWGTDFILRDLLKPYNLENRQS